MKIARKSIIISLMVTMVLLVSVSLFSEDVCAATQGDKVAQVALECEGLSLKGVQAYMNQEGYSMWLPKFKGDWCAWFVSNCARAGGVSTTVLPNETYASYKGGDGFYQWAVKNNRFRGTKYVPKPGDVCFFDGVYGPYGHVEIVYAVRNGKVYTIGGNAGSDPWPITTVKKRSFTPSNSFPNGYIDVNYKNSCTHKSTNKQTGKCSKCGLEYINYDKPDVSKATSYANKYFYKIKAETYLKKYPSASAQNKSSAKLPAGKHVNVIGTLSNGSWYKIKYGGSSKYIGYVPASAIQKYTPGNDSTIKFGDVKDNYTVVHGSNPGMDTTVSSNYPIRNITVQIGTKKYTQTFKSLYLSKNLNLKKNT